MARKLQVFISSTYLDLRDERQAAVEAVFRAGHIPAGMELFVAGNLSQWKVIEAWIRQSDVLVLLLGSRYGSIHPDTGVSYTEMEYRLASECGIPTIGIVLSDSYANAKVAFDGQWDDREQPNYKGFKQTVTQKMCAEAQDIKDIKLEVTNSLYETALDNGLVGWIRADEVAPPPALIAERERLTAENDVLRKRVQALVDAVPQDRAVESSIEVLKAYGFHEIEYVNKVAKQGTFYTMDLWLLHIGRILAKFPHAIGPGHGMLYHSVAPTLVTYGLMQAKETETDSLFGGKPIKWKQYEFTDLGSRVHAELMRRGLGKG